MRNHKCGTCRFYQEAQLASSGWCHHPQRKTTSDIMIMVRKNELACRDEWAHDLWEAKTAQSGTPAPASGQFSDRKERPATEAEIAALLGASSATPNHEAAGTDASDIVLSELGAGPEPLTYVERVEPPRPWAQASSRSVEPVDSSSTSVEHASSNRGSIFRAREAFRERSRQDAARSQLTAHLATDATPSSHAASSRSVLDDPVVEPLGASKVEPLAADADQPGSHAVKQPEPASGPTDDAVDSRLDFDVTHEPQTGSSTEWRQDDLIDSGSERPSWTDDIVAAASDIDVAATQDAPLAATTEPEPARRHELDDPFDFGYGVDREESVPRESGTSQAGEAPRYSASQSGPQPSADRYATERDPYEPERQPYADRPSYWSRSGPTAERLRQYDDPEFDDTRQSDRDVAYDNIEPDVIDEIADTSRLIDLEAEREMEAITQPDDESLYEDVVVDNDSDSDVIIPLRPALSAHLPRICRTCRDFRPGETSDRGWCANQWAFSHRRVVAAEEQVPCDSVVGDWWLPADEVWSDAADVSSHGQPTPLLDAWLPEYQEHLPSRRRS